MVGPGTVAELKRKTSLVHGELVEKEQDIMASALAVLGAHPRPFRREKKQAVIRLVSEIYPPPRVTEMSKHMSNHDLTPGLALDLPAADPDDGKPRGLGSEEGTHLLVRGGVHGEASTARSEIMQPTGGNTRARRSL